MTQATRQRKIFAAEDYRVVYRAFREVNFTAYDFETIRTALIDYIRVNFSEDFNDWIESSEFVALIEMISYLGQSLSFRMDLNTRENFIDTASRRDSILKLARLISYQARRNLPSQGLLKLQNITTTEPVVDSSGNNLSNVTIRWNDPVNPDWFEQFILVMNSIFSSTTQFGSPLKKGTVNSIRTETYQLNNRSSANRNFPFTSNIRGQSMSFDIVNPDFTDGETFFERAPDPQIPLHIIYRNDGQGNNSANTGFFVYFKQGNLQFEDFDISVPISNRILEIGDTGINDIDVYVQEIDQQGLVIDQWTKVPAVDGNNVIFNNLENNQRNIFSVITQPNDGASIRFADGGFGNVPVGLIRVWYRTSNGLRYQIRPEDMRNISLDIPYNGKQNNRNQTASFSFALQTTVTNSAPAQTNEQIRTAAPQIYYTQDRMVNGQDYNVFPLQNSETARLKAVNRIYSGFSQFFDINDPSSISQNINVVGEDGLLYLDENNTKKSLAVPTALTNAEIIDTCITPLLQSAALQHFFYFNYPAEDVASLNLIWNTSVQGNTSTQGRFEISGAAEAVGPNSGKTDGTEFITNGSILIFDDGTTAPVISVAGNGVDSDAINLGVLLNSGVQLVSIYKPFTRLFDSAELTAISGALSLQRSFGIRYDENSLQWMIINNLDLAPRDQDFDISTAGNTFPGIDTSWLIRADFLADQWCFEARGLDYVFESVSDVRFYRGQREAIVDSVTGETVNDNIKLFPDNIVLNFEDVFVERDGFIETRRIKLTTVDADTNGNPDNPVFFSELSGLDSDNINDPIDDSMLLVDDTELFWRLETNSQGFEEYVPFNSIAAISNEYSGLDVTPDDGYLTPNSTSSDAILYGISVNEIVAVRNGNSGVIEFYQRNSNPFESTGEQSPFVEVTDQFRYRRGARNLTFRWKHFAPAENRIDPASTNIIDMYVLTASYDTIIRTWIDENGALEDRPQAPTSEDLRILYNQELENKMISDEVIFHPVQYKVLFGEQAEPELRAKFKITKIPGSEISDGEIRTRVISTINEYFGISNWDFGETFYFTELAAFIHQRLATAISSVVLVPEDAESAFGDLFQVRSEPNEVFISSAKVADVQIVNTLTSSNLRIGR